jgi:hypothetical protein
MNTVEEKVYSAHSAACRTSSGAQTPGGSTMWSPTMWRIIDSEMDLENCSVYSYRPQENPFDDEDTALWSLHYFFFNKQKKRVTYLYLRGLKIRWYDLTGDNKYLEAEPKTPKRKHARSRSSMDFGASKRARYWLGERADELEDDAEEEVEVIQAPGDDEVDADVDVDYIDEMIRSGRSISPLSVSSEESEDEVQFVSQRERRKSNVRAV